MLSSGTVELLDTLAFDSHASYPEGGILYTFIEAANQANFRFPEQRSGSIETLSELDVQALAKYLTAALGMSHEKDAIAKADGLSTKLLGRLSDELKYDEGKMTFVDEGDSGTALIELARRSDNRFFSLEFWWSID